MCCAGYLKDRFVCEVGRKQRWTEVRLRRSFRRYTKAIANQIDCFFGRYISFGVGGLEISRVDMRAVSSRRVRGVLLDSMQLEAA
jgi:hypothetical protein